MERYITDERTGLKYELVGDYYLTAVCSVIVKFITPALILIVEIFGVKSEIDGGNAPVVIATYGLIAVCVILYFIFFRNAETGTNDDEIAVDGGRTLESFNEV